MLGGTKTAMLLVVAVFLVTPALATQGSFDLQTDLPITVEGDRTTTADQGAFLLEGDQGDVTLLISAEGGTLTRTIHRASGYIKPDEPQAGVLWNQEVETHNLDLKGAHIVLEHRTPDFTFLAHDGAIQVDDGNPNTPLHLGVLASPKTVTSGTHAPIEVIVGNTESQPFKHLLRSGLFESRSLDGRLTTDAPLFIDGAVLTYIGGDGARSILRAHFREEQRPGALFDPVASTWTGPGSHTEYVQEHVTLTFDSASVQLQHRNVPATLFAAKPTIQTTGTATFPAATGHVALADDSHHTLNNDAVTLGGDFTFDLLGTQAGRTRADVTGSGELTQVTYRSATHEYAWTVAVATGLGAIALAAVAWVSGAGKWLLGSMGGLVAGYARVHGDAVLQHDGRQTVYDLVQAHAGLNFQELCDKLPFGASTLTYHLRVLERNEFVTRVKDGRYVRFFDRRNGNYSQGRKTAVSTLRNETTAAIAQHIVSHPGIVQRDLASQFGIAPSTVSWHVGRLQQNGLVEKQRDQHFTRYYMGDAWSTLPTDERTRFGVA